MLTSIRGLTAVSLLTTTALIAAPAMAKTTTETESQNAVAMLSAEQDETPVLSLSGPLIDTSALIDSTESDAATVTILRASPDDDLSDESQVGGESGFEISGNVAVVSDYRFRGISFSDGDPALQGGIDIGHSSGLYIGTWGSTITGGTPFGELELDIYAGWSGEVSDGVTFDIGLLYYIYPTGDFANVNTDYFEPYASISGDLGPLSATLGVAYAWDQSVLGNQDNVYIYTDFEYGISGTPVSLSAHLGYTDGVFSPDFDQTAFDWGVGVSYAVTSNLSLGVNYVDTQGPSVEDFSDAGIFFTIGYSM